jgi:hypothetical protein
VAAVTWLAVAQAALLLIPARPPALALLAVAFAAPPLLQRLRPAIRPMAAAPIVAMLAIVVAAGALAVQSGGSATGGTAKVDAAGDDAYYGK